MKSERVPLAGLEPKSHDSPTEQHLQLEATAHDVDYPVGPTERIYRASETCIKVSLGTSLAVAVTLAVILSVFSAQQQQGKASFELRFLVVGDWGRQGAFNQSEVAQLMGRTAEALQPEFIISTGDNYYPHGLNSSDDSLFDESFVRVYNSTSLQVPWHAVLGNHDYGDGDYDHNAESCLKDDYPCLVSPMYQLGSGLLNRDPRWHCERQYVLSLAGGLVDLFFIDTTPFVKKYRKRQWAKYEGGVLQQSWEAQLRELEGQLAASTAPWKLVVGHHPPHSNGHHGDTVELIEFVEPLLAQYGVQAWLAGHDHSLEHLFVPSARYHIIVSGAGSRCNRGFFGDRLSRYQWPWSGFVAATLTDNQLQMDFYHLENGDSPAYTALIPRTPR